MGYYVETLNAGDTERRAYKQANTIQVNANKIMANFDKETYSKLVRSVAAFDHTGYLSNNEQVVLLNNFGKTKDRPSTFVYVLLSWANDLGIAMTKKSLRGSYKKTFGSQLDYRYVRVISNLFKLKFFKGVKVDIQKEAQELRDFEELLNENTPTNKVIQLLQSNQEAVEDIEGDRDSQEWAVEESLEEDCVGENDQEVSIEPTENLDAILVKQKQAIKSLTDFIHAKGLMYEYLMSQQ